MNRRTAEVKRVASVRARVQNVCEARLTSLLLSCTLLFCCSAVLLLSCSELPDGDELAGSSRTENTISGFVQDSSGSPIADARVKLRRQDYLKPPPGLGKEAVSFTTITTDADGFFHIDSVDTGAYLLEIISDENGTLLDVVIPDNAFTGIDLSSIVPGPTGTITGFVEVPDQSWDVYVQVYGTDHIVKVDSKTGTFVLEGMPQGVYKLRIYFAAHQDNNRDVSTVIVEQEKQTVVDTVSVQGPEVTTNSLTGTVSGINGHPVPGAVIQIRKSTREYDFAGSEYSDTLEMDVLTDDRGRFEVRGLEAGEYLVEVDDGAGSGTTFAVVFPENSTSVYEFPDVVVKPPGSIRGIIKLPLTSATWIWYPEGNPVKSAPAETRFFRYEFTVPTNKEITSAVCVFTADDSIGLYINGVHAGDRAPWREMFTFDVVSLLKNGENVLAVSATNTTVSPAGMVGSLTITFSDGTSYLIGTGTGWLSSNTEESGWQQPGFNDASWEPVMELGTHGMDPWGKLTTDNGETPVVLKEGVVFQVQLYGTGHRAVVDTATGEFILEGVPEGTYSLKVTSAAEMFMPGDIQGIEVVSDMQTVLDTIVLSENYSIIDHTVQVKINTSASGADITETVADFPLLIRLNAANFDFGSTASNGADIRFSKPDGTHLNYEIERWDPINLRAEIWVRVDTVYGNSSSQYINMHWGGNPPVDSSHGETVFDRSHFNAVWHLDEVGVGDEGHERVFRDVTGNGNHGDDFISAGRREGVAGWSNEFDGEDDYIHIPPESYKDLDEGTISAWVFLDSNNWETIIAKQSNKVNSYGILTIGYHSNQSGTPVAGDAGRIYFHGLDYYPEATSDDLVDIGEWTHIAVVFSSTAVTFFINGVASGTKAGVFSIPNDPEAPITRIGSWGGDGGGAFYDGKMDEIRISTVARSPNWMKLSYENQKKGSAVVIVE